MFSIIKRDLASDLAAIAQDFHNQMNDLANLDLFFEPIGRSFPKVNVSETDEAYVIEAALSGYKKEQIKIEVNEEDGCRYLTLKGEKSGKSSNKDSRYLSQEVHFSSFHRSWTLPTTVNVDAIKTNMEDGVLNIEIPKSDPKKVKKEITIN
jgi:HSP20 family protein